MQLSACSCYKTYAEELVFIWQVEWNFKANSDFISNTDYNTFTGETNMAAVKLLFSHAAA